MKYADLAHTQVWKIIEKELIPHGFEGFPARPYFARVRDGALYDIVGFRWGKDDKDSAAIFFCTWVPEMNELQADPKKNQLKSMKGFSEIFELSPIAPLKNTYWWPLEGLNQEEISSLEKQLHEVTLPYFLSIQTHAQMLSLWKAREEGHVVNPKLMSELSLRLTKDGFISSPFVFWRQRGELIDMIAIDSLADGRFSSFYFAVWHTSLKNGISGEVKDGGVTMATSQRIFKKGMDGDATSALWFMNGKPSDITQMADEVSSLAGPYFEKITTQEQVIALIPQEFRRYLLEGE